MSFAAASRSVRQLRTCAAALGLFAGSFALLPSGFAQEDEAAIKKAREMFTEGISFEKTESWEDALSRFKQVAEVKPTPKVRYHIGLCQEKLGKYVDALGTYRVALKTASESNAKDIEALADSAIKALEPKIPRLVIKRGEGARTAEITLDKKVLGATSVGKELRLDLGPHLLSATAPEREPFKEEFELAEGEQKTIEVVLSAPGGTAAVATPPLKKGESEPAKKVDKKTEKPAGEPEKKAEPPEGEPESSEEPEKAKGEGEPDKKADKKGKEPEKKAAGPSKKAPPPPRDEPPPEPEEEGMSTNDILGYSFLGGGVIGLAMSGVFYGTYSKLYDKCADGGCTADEDSSGRRAAVLFPTLGVLGLASAGTGAYFLWFAPKDKKAEPKVSIAPTLNGAMLFGSF